MCGLIINLYTSLPPLPLFPSIESESTSSLPWSRPWKERSKAKLESSLQGVKDREWLCYVPLIVRNPQNVLMRRVEVRGKNSGK